MDATMKAARPAGRLWQRLQLEEMGHLTPAQRGALAKALHLLARRRSLAGVEAQLKASLPDWFVYRGGEHVALHLRSGDPRRVLLVAFERVGG